MSTGRMNAKNPHRNTTLLWHILNQQGLECQNSWREIRIPPMGIKSIRVLCRKRDAITPDSIPATGSLNSLGKLHSLAVPLYQDRRPPNQKSWEYEEKCEHCYCCQN